MVTKLPRASKEADMQQLEAKVKKLVLDTLPEPPQCVKTEVILYKHKAGRINLWHKTKDSSNLDIISYYIVYDNSKIQILDDKGLVTEIVF